jgi:beta-galactosidase/evolved beta-galactosidase subunit alpha
VLGAFESEIEARNNVMQAEASPFVESIGGVWGFKLFSSVNDALEAVHLRAGSIQVDPIIVPGHWQLQGFGDHPIYTNFRYIIPVDPPHVPENNPTGYYEHEFLLSDSWRNRRIIITFGGVDSAFYVWINHKFVGFSKDSRLPTDFDVTDVVKFGDSLNTVQVVVPRFNDGSYLEDQDMWNLSGIFRDVLISSFPKPVHIQDFK